MIHSNSSFSTLPPEVDTFVVLIDSKTYPVVPAEPWVNISDVTSSGHLISAGSDSWRICVQNDPQTGNLCPDGIGVSATSLRLKFIHPSLSNPYYLMPGTEIIPLRYLLENEPNFCSTDLAAESLVKLPEPQNCNIHTLLGAFSRKKHFQWLESRQIHRLSGLSPTNPSNWSPISLHILFESQAEALEHMKQYYELDASSFIDEVNLTDTRPVHNKLVNLIIEGHHECSLIINTSGSVDVICSSRSQLVNYAYKNRLKINFGPAFVALKVAPASQDSYLIDFKAFEALEIDIDSLASIATRSTSIVADSKNLLSEHISVRGVGNGVNFCLTPLVYDRTETRGTSFIESIFRSFSCEHACASDGLLGFQISADKLTNDKPIVQIGFLVRPVSESSFTAHDWKKLKSALTDAMNKLMSEHF